jgi:sugar/nucleoside kinase (ribokinase family)
MAHRGLFVGLTTLDLIYGVPHFPHANEKQVATELAIAAGGPATNAAVAFRHLGNQSVLLSAVGQHPLSMLVRTDLATQQVELKDLCPERTDPLPLSSILVTQSTGDRSVVSRNAVNLQMPANRVSMACLENIDIVLMDGHQLEVSLAIAQMASLQNISVVLDGGSWKPGLERLLPFIDYAVCSANFFPPDCTTSADAMQYLIEVIGSRNLKKAIPPGIAITRGEQPIRYFHQGQMDEVFVPAIQAVDTLGAGDVFHGAFCYAILQVPFTTALQQAIAVASIACQSFGTRQWLQNFSFNQPDMP